MRIKAVRVENFRRLRSVTIDLDDKATVCVGANNSGKTSVTHIFRSFFLNKGRDLTLYDFHSGCWADFEQADNGAAFPVIMLDLLLEVEREDWHRVVELMTLQDLDEEITEVALRVEFGPKDGHDALLANYREARQKADESRWSGQQGADGGYKPWPASMWQYLDRTLKESYTLSYHVLDPASFHHRQSTRVAGPLADSTASAQRYLDELIRVDMVDAQRFLSDDSTSNGRDLSRHLRRFYKRNINTGEVDHDALQALRASEMSYEQYLEQTLSETFSALHQMSYPGLREAPRLVVRSRLDNDSILTDSASVHYEFAPNSDGTPRELPERYNGLGYKNLFYMLIEIIDMYAQWSKADVKQPALHMVMIEEPEAHMHPQLQQGFLETVRDHADKKAELGFHTQLVVTTHSPHIIHNTGFKPIRYFRRLGWHDGAPAVEVRDLSRVDMGENADFLRRFLKLTNCHLFFADAVVLAEGDAERLLLPRMIDSHTPRLTALERAHVSILEVSGSHAFRFRSLVEFLGLPTLIITDLDSVNGPKGAVCRTDEPGARTCNPTLKRWLPRKVDIEKLLDIPEEDKVQVEDPQASVRVTYQTREPCMWQESTQSVAGRTFEEAFLLENLQWALERADELPLGLSADLTLAEVLDAVHEFARRPRGGKTNFALTLVDLDDWRTPGYIKRGLEWLDGRLSTEAAQ
ncbi:ATP-dependent nuclease [Streptomonospora arabica]|uniref:ATP-dependent endonuclease n=1 Tax=Streptomonospora arabica TaxID=412417 RepID=A0ABV9SHN7_9ACTN